MRDFLSIPTNFLIVCLSLQIYPVMLVITVAHEHWKYLYPLGLTNDLI